MFKNLKNIFSRKVKAIEDEIALKSKVDKVLTGFVRSELLKDSDLDCQLSYTFNKGIIKIETDSKIVAQEIALRIRVIENRLRSEGVIFKKLLV